MEEYRIRVRIFIGIILCALGLLSLRLVQLQLIEKQEYQDASRGNAIREVRVQAARGAVFDRNGTLMVGNEPTYTVTLTPRYFDPSKTTLLAGLLGVPDSIVTNSLKEARQRWGSYSPSRSFRNVPFDIYSRIRENSYLLPGVGDDIDQKRRYFTNARASHALGYIREITRGELDQHNGQAIAKYRPGDLVGKTGIERKYEPLLRGQPGSAFKVVNVKGLVVKEYQSGQEDTPPFSGYDVHLALDQRVQALAESLFVGNRGAAVAIDPTTGGIIALVSKPDFDPAMFSQRVDQESWDYLNTNPEKPLYNRATMNLMPPGSTFKPFIALMSLAEGNIELSGANSTVYCTGGHPLGRGKFFRCLGVHGHINVRDAIKHSCNTFFFEMARRVDVNTLKKYATMFGFGMNAPTDIAEQQPGLIPDSSYYNQRFPNWDVGYPMNLGVGQGDMGVSPLQLARYIAAVANKGTLHPPSLVAYLEHPETGEIIRPDRPDPELIPIREAYFDVVREGMRLVMEEGSGMGAQIPGIPSGGKTGTAQTSGGMEDHSVFVMFAPYDNPKIAVAVQVENAGFGGRAAAPIASLMAELYLKGELPDSYEVQSRMTRALSARSQPLRRPARSTSQGATTNAGG